MTLALIVVAILLAVTQGLEVVLALAGKPMDANLSATTHTLIGLFVLLAAGRVAGVELTVKKNGNGNGN